MRAVDDGRVMMLLSIKWPVWLAGDGQDRIDSLCFVDIVDYARSVFEC